MSSSDGDDDDGDGIEVGSLVAFGVRRGRDRECQLDWWIGFLHKLALYAIVPSLPSGCICTYACTGRTQVGCRSRSRAGSGRMGVKVDVGADVGGGGGNVIEYQTKATTKASLPAALY